MGNKDDLRDPDPVHMDLSAPSFNLEGSTETHVVNTLLNPYSGIVVIILDPHTALLLSGFLLLVLPLTLLVLMTSFTFWTSFLVLVPVGLLSVAATATVLVAVFAPVFVIVSIMTRVLARGRRGGSFAAVRVLVSRGAIRRLRGQLVRHRVDRGKVVHAGEAIRVVGMGCDVVNASRGLNNAFRMGFRWCEQAKQGNE